MPQHNFARKVRPWQRIFLCVAFCVIFEILLLCAVVWIELKNPQLEAFEHAFSWVILVCGALFCGYLPQGIVGASGSEVFLCGGLSAAVMFLSAGCLGKMTAFIDVLLRFGVFVLCFLLAFFVSAFMRRKKGRARASSRLKRAKVRR